MTPDAIDSEQLLAAFVAGKSSVADDIFNRYAKRLAGLARERLSPSLRRRVDPEDIVQSAFRSFFVHAPQGEYALARSGDLWRLLAAITLHKLRDQVDRHRAKRRDYRRERTLSPTTSDSEIESFGCAATSPATVDELAAIEHLEAAFNRLPRLARQALSLRLAGNTIEDIAAALERSERTARRLLDEARHELTRELSIGNSVQ
jgi:RNA polymerase sigma factor (sigma-70 family)